MSEVSSPGREVAVGHAGQEVVLPGVGARPRSRSAGHLLAQVEAAAGQRPGPGHEPVERRGERLAGRRRRPSCRKKRMRVSGQCPLHLAEPVGAPELAQHACPAPPAWRWGSPPASAGSARTAKWTWRGVKPLASSLGEEGRRGLGPRAAASLRQERAGPLQPEGLHHGREAQRSVEPRRGGRGRGPRPGSTKASWKRSSSVVEPVARRAVGDGDQPGAGLVVVGGDDEGGRGGVAQRQPAPGAVPEARRGRPARSRPGRARLVQSRRVSPLLHAGGPPAARRPRRG